MQLNIQAQVHPVWSTVRELRKRVGALMAEYPESVRGATEMVASELLENAIKYAESVPQAPEIEFSCSIDEGTIRVCVANGVVDAGDLGRLRACIDELANSTEKADLYMKRLQRLMSEPTESAGLGLYRIGFEGEFHLRLEVDQDVVRVVATRSTS